MALSLGVSVASEITIGPDSLLTVLDIVGGTKVTILVDGKKFQIDDQERQEVLPGVFVSCGLSHATRGSRTSRLAFEAPREIKIDRVKGKKNA